MKVPLPEEQKICGMEYLFRKRYGSPSLDPCDSTGHNAEESVERTKRSSEFVKNAINEIESECMRRKNDAGHRLVYYP